MWLRFSYTLMTGYAIVIDSHAVFPNVLLHPVGQGPDVLLILSKCIMRRFQSTD
jgi:hypothetical protein